MKDEKKCIGWVEWLALPEFEVPRIKVKVDTGATTSALHAENIKIIKGRLRDTVYFTIYPYQKHHQHARRVKARVVDYRRIRSSNGKVELRPIVETEAILHGIQWTIQLSLTDRSLMGYRMLLGRKAMKGRFLIDVSKTHMASKKKKKKKKVR